MVRFCAIICASWTRPPSINVGKPSYRFWCSTSNGTATSSGPLRDTRLGRLLGRSGNMTTEEILFDAEERMEKAITVFRDELRGLRTGRATPALVEHIRVEYYGSPTPLKALAT